MIWRLGLIALAVAAPAAAQTTVPPPSTALPVPDAMTPYVVARGTVDTRKGALPLQLLVSGDDAAVRGMLPGESQWRYFSISADPDAALRLLADRRLEFLWAPLLTWAGSDLGLLRQRMVTKAERAYAIAAPRAPQNSADSTVRAPTRALLQLASVLVRAGYVDRAFALLDEERATRSLKRADDQAEWVVLTLRRANLAIMIGRNDEAITLLAKARERIGRDNFYGLNLDVNRAAALANLGRSADALALITDARAKLDREGPRKSGGVALAGSDRQFAWIRGCALHGLGREDEARAASASVINAPEPADPFFKTESNDGLRFRVVFCSRDANALADLIAADIEKAVIAPTGLLVMQPAWRTTNDPGGVFAAARADPALRLAAARWMRELPPALIPALHGWR